MIDRTHADSHVETISLAYLYMLPLALSAMTFRMRVTATLIPVRRAAGR